MVATVHKFPFRGLKNTENVMVFNTSPMNITRFVHLDPIRDLTAFHAPKLQQSNQAHSFSCTHAASKAPKLHWQLAITCRGLPSKTIFQNSPCCLKTSQQQTIAL